MEGFLELLRLLANLLKAWARSGNVSYGQGLRRGSGGVTTTGVSLSLVLGPEASSAKSSIDGTSS